MQLYTNAETHRKNQLSTYSCAFKLSPRLVSSKPGPNANRLGSDWGGGWMNANRPTIPNWSATIPCGMFVMRPEIHSRLQL